MGTTRLAIRDSRDIADQPYRSPSGRWVVTYNGELSNDAELRMQLSFTQFRTWCDTETIAIGLDAFGLNFIKKLRGMFALGILDCQTGALHLYRDFPGIKPLYWAELASGRIVYASEFPAILSMLREASVSTGLSESSMVEYLMYRATLIQPRTLLNGINKVSPGEVITFHRNRSPSHHQLFSITYDNVSNASSEDLEQNFASSISGLIEPSLKLGAFISGGVDSSTVLAEMVRQEVDVTAITLQYESTGAYSFSEMPFSRFVCEYLGVPLIEVSLDEEQFIEEMMKAIPLQDGCSMDPTIVAWRVLGRHAAENGIRVTMSGTGSDEIFGSYEWLHANTFEQFDRWMRPISMHDLLRISPQVWEDVLKDVQMQRRSVIEKYESMGFSFEESLRLFGMFHLEADALPRVDLGTMASSVECRVPLLDQRLMLSALSHQPEPKKTSYRSIALKRLPREIHNRPKCGFPHPVFIWLKHGKLRNLVVEVLSDPSFAHIVDFAKVNRMLTNENSLLLSNPSAATYEQCSSVWYLFAFLFWCNTNHVRVESLVG